MSKSHLLVVLSVGGSLAWLFAPALVGGQSFAFRDAAHFYHPLFEYLRAEWGAGRVPLWNPYENTGLALAAETTTSVFYPGKLVFLLPLDDTLLYNLYIVGHVALAAFTSFRLARHWGATAAAAGIAALSYAFCGNVLFQCANVVYLVGAAWLPLALLLTDRMLRERSFRAAVGLGVVLALMVVGGDPQMAYNAGLIAVLYAMLLRRDTAGGRGSRRAGGGLTLLGIATVTGVTLAAIQILPAWQATRGSARAAYDAPRSVYELVSYVAADHAEANDTPSSWYAGLIGSTEGHPRAIYEFSVGPWRAIEYVWPNIYGRQFPTHRRWLAALPAEGRAWTPSLYMGLLPLVLAAVTWSVRRASSVEVRLLSWIVLLAALASLGIFGLAWLVREVAAWFGGSAAENVGGEVGGLYWLFTVLLPGYVYFRYPAKLLLVAALGLSMLAARGWDDVWQSRPQRAQRTLMGLSIASLIALVIVLAIWPMWSDVVSRMPPDPLFGPFDAAGAQGDVVGGLVQTIVISLVFYALATPVARAAVGRQIPAIALAVTVIDLAIAQSWLVPYGPSETWDFEPDLVKSMPMNTDYVRIYRDSPLISQKWSESSSPDRLQEIVRFERESLSPKYPLRYRLALVEASSTIAPYDLRVVMDVARAHAGQGAGKPMPHPSVLDLLGADYAVLPRKTAGPSGLKWSAQDQVALIERDSAMPRAWIVHDVERFWSLAARTPASVKRRTEEVLFPGDNPRDWRAVAVVETDDALAPLPKPPPAGAREHCRIREADPLAVEIEARLASPGLVVLSDAYAPGWTLTVETDGVSRHVPILRTNRVMRGALLPTGSHRLVYRYRPAAFVIGAILSGVTALGLVAIIAVRLLRNGVRWPIVARPPSAAGG